MANPSKRKGTAWETECAKYLGTRRLPLAGAKDVGDLDTAYWVVECKAEQRIDLAGYMDEVAREVANSDKLWGVTLVKRRRRSVEQGYAVMTIETWRQLEEPWL